MKMINNVKKKNGFTLVELMGVLVIIGVLSAILIPVITNTLKENKEKAYQAQLQNIILATKNFVSDNMFLMPETEGDSISVTLGQLKKSGYMEHTIINPKTKDEISNCLLIKIKKINNNFEYSIQEETIKVDNCNENYTSDILISGPSKAYIKKGGISSYILMISPNNEEQVLSYTFDDSKLSLGEGTDSKYSVIGENGIYKIIIKAGEIETDISLTLEPGAITDSIGNNIDISDIAYDKIIVDNTAPSCGNWEGQSTTWTNNPRTITMNGIDNLSGIKSTAFSQTFSSGEITTRYLSHTIEDNAGNTNFCSTTADVYVDTVAPNIVINTYIYDSSTHIIKKENSNTDITDWKNYGYHFKGNESSDYSGIAETKWEWNEMYSAELNKTIKDYSIHPGIHEGMTLTGEGYRYGIITMKDQAGNSRSVEVAVKIDTTGPNAPAVALVDGSWNELSDNTWYNKNVHVSGSTNSSVASPSATDNLSGVSKYQISSDGSTWYDWNYWNGTYSLYHVDSEGTNYRYVRAIDNAGNTGKTTTKTIKVDKTAPSFTSCTWQENYVYPGGWVGRYALVCNWSEEVYRRYGHCYGIADNPNNTSSCNYKSLEDRFSSSTYQWMGLSEAFGFQINIDSGDSINIKIQIQDVAGNTATNTYTYTRP